MIDPRLSEATEEQLRERLEDLQSRELAAAVHTSMGREIQDVRSLQDQLMELTEKVRIKIAIETRVCRVCKVAPCEPCGLKDGDTHMIRTFGIDPDAIEARARSLRPDLFKRMDRYIQMVKGGERGAAP